MPFLKIPDSNFFKMIVCNDNFGENKMSNKTKLGKIREYIKEKKCST